MPTGTLTKKIQFQLACSVSRPPISGPSASASAEVPAQIPIAVPRWRGGNVTAMIDSVAGFISAAPTPCAMRAAMSVSPLEARPQAREARVKIVMPVTKTSRRPYASASLPPISISAANVSAYPETTHSSSERPTPRSRWIDGSATFTTVLSSMIMNSPNETAPSVHHFLLSSVTSPANTPIHHLSKLVRTTLARSPRATRRRLTGTQPRRA